MAREFERILISQNKQNLDIAYLRMKAKEFVEVERSDVSERLEELLGTTLT